MGIMCQNQATKIPCTTTIPKLTANVVNDLPLPVPTPGAHCHHRNAEQHRKGGQEAHQIRKLLPCSSLSNCRVAAPSEPVAKASTNQPARAKIPTM